MALNVTVVSPTGGGSLTVYPDAGQPTGTPLINFSAGSVRADNTTLALSSTGGLTLQATIAQNGRTDVVVDVVGFFR